MLVLAIETSCDDTAAAVMEHDRCLSSVVWSQDSVHAKYGGVVPELASRNHIANIFPVAETAIAEAGVHAGAIQGVAATFGPGLIGSLLVGLEFAKAFAWSRGLPFVAVNHLEGHLCAAELTGMDIPYPHLGLIVSGGHTSLYQVDGQGVYRLLGATRDDAAGEAFDKAAKMLGLGYPGGKAISELAETGDPLAVKFTRQIPMKDSMDFSFSGLKAAFRRHIQEHGIPRGDALSDLAASFQHAVVESIAYKVGEAMKLTGVKNLVAAGGVAANMALREALTLAVREQGGDVLLPPPELCTDNAAMIAVVGCRRLRAGERDDLNIEACARAPL